MRHVLVVSAWALISACLVPSRAVAIDLTVNEIETLMPEKPWLLGRPISDRAYWDKLTALAGGAPVQTAEKALAVGMPAWSDDAYLEFFITGRRQRGQAMLSPRWQRMRVLALGELCENRGRFLPALEECLISLAKQPSWVMPAHDTRKRVFEGKLQFVDLAAADEGFDVALVLGWFGDRLSPQVRGVLSAELKKRVIDPTYLGMEGKDERISKQHWWRNSEMNWNAVCTEGTTGAILAFEPSKHRRALAVQEAVRNSRRFLAGFTPDGYCGEGLGYWNYGFGHFAMMSRYLYDVTGGRVDLTQEPRVTAAASYADRLCLGANCYPVLADCHAGVMPERWIGWILANAPDGNRTAPAGSFFKPGWFLYQQVMLGERALASGSGPSASGKPLAARDEFPEGGLMVLRDGEFAAALKAGHNAEPHNHNDVGSYVVRVGGATPVLDPGSTEYTSATFSAMRYQHPILSSYGHSVPVLNGVLQSEGRDRHGEIVKRESGSQSDAWAIDFTSCYPGSGVKKLVRNWTFARGERPSLAVCDQVEFEKPGIFETAVVGAPDWAVAADGTFLVRAGKSIARVSIVSDAPFDTRLEKIANEHAYEPVRLGVRLKDQVSKAEVRIVIAPATEDLWKAAKPATNLPVIRELPRLQAAR